MRLADYLSKGSLWEAIRGLAPFPFLETYTPENMDAQLDLYYGHRQLFSKMEEMGVDKVALSVVMQFKDKWDNLIKIAALDVGLESANTKVTTIKNGVVQNSSDTNSSKKLVSAFNSDELIVDSGTDGTAAGEKKTDTTGTISVSDKDRKSVV